MTVICTYHGVSRTYLVVMIALILQDSVVLIFPGAAGPDSSTELLKERILNSDKENGAYFKKLNSLVKLNVTFYTRFFMHSLSLLQELTDMWKFMTGSNGEETS